MHPSSLEIQRRDLPGLGHVQMKDTGKAIQQNAVQVSSHRLFRKASFLLRMMPVWSI